MVQEKPAVPPKLAEKVALIIQVMDKLYPNPPIPINHLVSRVILLDPLNDRRTHVSVSPSFSFPVLYGIIASSFPVYLLLSAQGGSFFRLDVSSSTLTGLRPEFLLLFVFLQ